MRLHEPALLQPLRWKRPRRIFWNAHGDLFHPAVPDAWIDRVFAACALTPQHTHMILTKRSARMREYLTARNENRPDCPITQAAFWSIAKPRGYRGNGGLCTRPLPNVWLGVSVEDQTRADERIPDLLATPAAKRFLSCEPLLGPVDLGKLLSGLPVNAWLTWLDALDWVIAGGESGPGARPMHPDWARSLRDQCAAADVPFYFKQWGEWLPGEIYWPASERGSNLVYWADGTEEWNGEWIDAHKLLSIHRPDDCAAEASEREQAEHQRWISASKVDEAAKSCPRPACATAGYCMGDTQPWHTIARKVGKKRAGHLLDGVEHNGFSQA